MIPPAKAGGFSEERLLTPTAAFQATAQVSPCGHLSRLAPEGPIRALKRGTPCSPQGLTARYVLRTPRFRACNPPNISCCEGATDSGAAPVRAANTVYSTHVREGNASRAVRGRAFRCQLKQAVPCPLLRWAVPWLRLAWAGCWLRNREPPRPWRWRPRCWPRLY